MTPYNHCRYLIEEVDSPELIIVDCTLETIDGPIPAKVTYDKNAPLTGCGKVKANNSRYSITVHNSRIKYILDGGSIHGLTFFAC